MSRFSVWSVGRDGNVEEQFSHDSPAESLESRRLLLLAYKTAKVLRRVGITDNENPEAGDVSDRLAEEVSK